MEVRSTPRVPLAFGFTALGLAVAVVAGAGEVAALVAPWFLLAVVAVTTRAGSGVRITVEPERERLMSGDELALGVSVTAGFDGFVRVQPELEQRHRDDPQRPPLDESALELLRADRACQVAFAPTMSQWGVWNVAPASVRIEGLFGLFELRGKARGTQLVRVHPSTAELRELITPLPVRRTTGLHPSRESDRGIEFADLRPYGPGDSRREINWRASARTDRLTVSLRHPDRAASVVLLLDSFVESGHDLGRVLTMEVEAALAIARGHLGATDRVGLVEFGGLVQWVTPSAGDRQLHRVTDALMRSSQHQNASKKQLPRLSPRLWPAGSLIVGLSPMLDPRFVEGLFEARRRGHEVAVIECVAYDDTDATEHDAARHVVGHRLRELERAMRRDELAASGIAVVRWHPGDAIVGPLTDLRHRRARAAARPGGDR